MNPPSSEYAPGSRRYPREINPLGVTIRKGLAPFRRIRRSRRNAMEKSRGLALLVVARPESD